MTVHRFKSSRRSVIRVWQWNAHGDSGKCPYVFGLELQGRFPGEVTLELAELREARDQQGQRYEMRKHAENTAHILVNGGDGAGLRRSLRKALCIVLGRLHLVLQVHGSHIQIFMESLSSKFFIW